MKSKAVDVMTDKVTEYMFIDENSEEWESMWQELSRLPCNKKLQPIEESCVYGLDMQRQEEEEGFGEAWQYMCSFYAPLNTIKNAIDCGWQCVYVHEFRHRHHPTLEKRVTVHLQASDAFTKAVDEKAMKEQEVEE